MNNSRIRAMVERLIKHAASQPVHNLTHHHHCGVACSGVKNLNWITSEALSGSNTSNLLTCCKTKKASKVKSKRKNGVGYNISFNEDTF